MCCSPHRFAVRAATHYHTQTWQTLIHGKECFILLLISSGTQSNLKGKGFNNPKGPSQCLCIRKNMFDHYYCMKSFCCLKTLEKTFRKFNYCGNYMYNDPQKHERYISFKFPVPRQRLTSLNYVNYFCMFLMMSIFVTSPKTAHTFSQKVVHKQQIALF